MEIISTHLILITMEVVINNTFKSYLSQFLQSDWSLGFDQLCWHNFRIIGTYLSGISIKHYSRIIGSGETFKGVV